MRHDSDNKPSILLYGAYGYTGTLIAREAARQNIPLLLAGRKLAPLKELAEETGFAYVQVSLSELQTKELPPEMNRIKVVLHAAGPYVETAGPMVETCLKQGWHYLDITGEWPVFQELADMDQLAKDWNIMILPGTGFDVVPSDCLAAFLHQQLPSATHLELAIRTDGGLSRGTAVTGVVHAKDGSRSRVNGGLVKEKAAQYVKTIPFSVGDYQAASIPWGDIVTSWHSTGIPNIRVFAAQPPKMIKQMKRMAGLSWILRIPGVTALIRNRIVKSITGPDETTLKEKTSEVWGKVWNDSGEQVEARVIGPQTYALTALTSLYMANQTANGNWKPGFQTPSSAYGADLILDACEAKREFVGRNGEG